MAGRINFKTMDFFKFKKLIIDGSRDDYNACSREVKMFCDCVQTLNFRDEEFDDDLDRGRFGEICTYYKMILSSARIETTDVKIKSGWWGDHKNAYSAGKIKMSVLREHLLQKCEAWYERLGTTVKHLSERMDGPGLFVFKHKDKQCFQYVGRADRIFARVAERLKGAFEGTLQDPLGALLIISMASDWDFYFISVGDEDDDRVLRILENDTILKHDCIWPHGLNFQLSINTLLEVSEFRKSCQRHHWPPDMDQVDVEPMNIAKLHKKVQEAQDIPQPTYANDRPVVSKSLNQLVSPVESDSETFIVPPDPDDTSTFIVSPAPMIPGGGSQQSSPKRAVKSGSNTPRAPSPAGSETGTYLVQPPAMSPASSGKTRVQSGQKKARPTSAGKREPVNRSKPGVSNSPIKRPTTPSGNGHQNGARSRPTSLTKSRASDKPRPSTAERK